MTYKITEYFGETKETIEREATADEITAFETRAAKYEALEIAKEEKAQAKLAAKAKLAALGLTVEDLQALGL